MLLALLSRSTVAAALQCSLGSACCYVLLCAAVACFS